MKQMEDRIFMLTQENKNIHEKYTAEIELSLMNAQELEL